MTYQICHRNDMLVSLLLMPWRTYLHLSKPHGQVVNSQVYTQWSCESTGVQYLTVSYLASKEDQGPH